MARLKVVVELAGIEAGHSRVNQLGASGDAAAQRITGAFSKAEQQVVRMIQQTQGWQRELDRLASQGGAWSQQASGLVLVDNAANRAAGVIKNVGTAHEFARGHAETHTRSLGRLTNTMESVAVQTLGLDRHLTKVSVLMGEMGAGGGPVLAVVAALAVLGFAYEKLTEHSREVAREQEAAVKSLRDFNREATYGAGGRMAADLERARDALDALKTKMDEFSGAKSPGGVFATIGSGFLNMVNAFREAFGGTPLAEQFAKLSGDLSTAQANLALRFGQTTGALALQIEKQRELNAAYGDGQLAIDQINIKYALKEAQLRNAIGLTDQERAAMNALATALRDVSNEAALLADNHRRLKDLEDFWKEIDAGAKQYLKTLEGLKLSTTELARSPVRTTPTAGFTFSPLPGGSGSSAPAGAAFSLEAWIAGRQKDQAEMADKITKEYREQAQVLESAARSVADIARGFGVADRNVAASIVGIGAMAAQLVRLRGAAINQQKNGGPTADLLLGSLPLIGGVASGSYALGGQIDNTSGAALGGAASGAAAGALIGSVVPLIGTAIGAVVGGVGGLVAGLFGHANKLKELRRDYEQSESKFIDSVTVYASQYARQFAGIQQAFQDLEDAARAAHTSVSADARAARTAAEARITTDFWKSVGEEFNALSGPAGEYLNAQNAIIDKYIEQRRTAEALGASTEALTRIDELRDKKLQDIIAEAEAQASSGLLGFLGDGGTFGRDNRINDILDPLRAINDPNMQWFDTFAQFVKSQDDRSRRIAEETESTAFWAQVQAQQQQKALDVAQDSLRAQEDIAKGLRDTIDALQKYSDSLKLSTLSPLSSAKRYAAAESQYSALIAKAFGGDQDAARAITSGGGNAFLQESVERFGGSARRSSDYDRVQRDVGLLETMFGSQLAVQDPVLEELKKQTAIAQAQLGAQQDTLVQQLVQRANDHGDEAGRIIGILRGMGYTLGMDSPGGSPTGKYYSLPYTSQQQGAPSYQARWDAYVAAHGGNPDLTTSEWIAAGMPAYATGTRFHRGGPALVGERGAELVNMPRGSSVTTSDQFSKPMVEEIRALRRDINTLMRAQTSAIQSSGDKARAAARRNN